MISIIGLVVIIVIAVFTYRTAKENGRKAGLWTFAVVAVGLTIQIFIPIIIAIIAVTIMAINGSSQEELQSFNPTWLTYFSIFCIIAGVIGSILILRYVSRIPDDENIVPPPPSNFNL